MGMPTFDPALYKQTTKTQWDDAAEAWHRWGPFLERWLGDATELMLDLAGVDARSRVLDIAAGAGGQTVAAARRAGAVLATDISPDILELAAAEARAAGLGNVATRVMDGESLGVEDVVAGLGDAPGHAVLLAELDLAGDAGSLRLVEDRVREARPHQPRHQVLEHRAAPG